MTDVGCWLHVQTGMVGGGLPPRPGVLSINVRRVHGRQGSRQRSE
jgi:hypothetical protein